MKDITKIDPHTLERFTPKRSNQIYATRKNQTAANNFKAREKRMEKHPAQSALDKDYVRIKNILGRNKERIISEDFLRGAEVDLLHFTSIGQTADKKYTVYNIYNYSIIQMDNKQYKIIRND